MAIRSILIANRGEIAARIARTCRELGIESIALQAPDDRDAFHTRACDRVVDVASYLDANAIAAAVRPNGKAFNRASCIFNRNTFLFLFLGCIAIAIHLASV